jgi:hypothetical protein
MKRASTNYHLKDDLMAYIFAFVREILLPGTDLDRVVAPLSFIRSPSEGFDAYVTPGDSTQHGYEIYMNRGVADQLFNLLRRIAAAKNCFDGLGLGCLRDMGIRDLDGALCIAYCHALCFVCLHELGHVAAGHVDFFNTLPPPVGSAKIRFNETTRLSMSGKIAVVGGRSVDAAMLNKCIELEADGTAFELLHDFQRNISAMSIPHKSGKQRVLADELADDQRFALQRCSLLGALSVVALLQRGWKESDAKKCASPECRLMNAFAALLRKSFPDTIRFEHYRTYFNRKNDRLQRQMPLFIQNVIVPVLWLLDQGLEAEGIDIRFFDLSDGGRASTSALLKDIGEVLSGGMPNNSFGGIELTRLTRRSGPYYKLLEGYRRVEWWSGKRGDALMARPSKSAVGTAMTSKLQ